MKTETRISEALELMMRFAEATGVTDDEPPPRRYLWTDAFAVCNFLELSRLTGEQGYHQLALKLVDQVHQVLGKHRPDDPRSGWISGLDEEEGAEHPTTGGLRIGKPQRERGPKEPFNQRLEWERDGQYFHYLTRWMHALDQTSRATEDERYRLWAVELAKAAHGAFVRRVADNEPPHLVWKMSIDLSRPLVPTTGQHDPLDGYVTLSQLKAALPSRASKAKQPDLGPALSPHRTVLLNALEPLIAYRSVSEEIEQLWREPANRRNPTWANHRDINDVMLATSLIPEGALSL